MGRHRAPRPPVLALLTWNDTAVPLSSWCLLVQTQQRLTIRPEQGCHITRFPSRSSRRGHTSEPPPAPSAQRRVRVSDFKGPSGAGAWQVSTP